MHRSISLPHLPRRACDVVVRALVVAFAVSPACWATIFKCSQEGNQVVYQDVPCPPGRELRDFDKDPAEVSVVPLGVAPRPAPASRAAPNAAPKTAPVARKKGGDAIPGNAAQRKFLAPGIGPGEVVARIGKPDMKTGGGKAKKGERWTYLPTPEDANTLTTLTFENGRLIEVERKVVR